MHPLVTAVVTTYNRSSLLKEALDSVLAQTLRDFVVLVADNGSKDDTPAVVAEYQRRDARVLCRRHERNIGINANLRQALEAADTPYVAWLMDDDLWLPGHLEAAVDAFERHPAALVYGTAAEQFGGGTGVLRPVFADGVRAISEFDFRRDFSPILFRTPLVGSCVVIRRQAVQQLRYWPDHTSTGDWLLVGQAALGGTLLYNPAVLGRYRWHEKNASYEMLRGCRYFAEHFYAERLLARAALEMGSLDPERLTHFLLAMEDLPATRTVLLALASCGSPRRLRAAAVKVLRRRPEIAHIKDKYEPLMVLAVRMPWLFPTYDLVSRILGRWWPPNPHAYQSGTAIPAVR